MHRWTALAALAVGALAVHPAPAAACSHPFGSGVPALVLPAAGSADAPLNAVVVVEWASWPQEDAPMTMIGDRLTLKTVGGQAIDASVTVGDPWGESYGNTITLRITPLALLPAHTAIELHAFMPSNFSVRDQVLGSFTTGATEDHEPPAAPQLTPVLGETFACDYGDYGCCGFGTPIRTGVIQGGEPGLVYTLTRADGAILDGAPAPLDGLVVCGTWSPDFDFPQRATMPWFVREGSYQITAVARDAAGNVSPPTTFTLAAPCTPLPPDAGVDAATGEHGNNDSGAFADCGCRIGGRAGSASGRGAWFGLLLLWAIVLTRAKT